MTLAVGSRAKGQCMFAQPVSIRTRVIAIVFAMSAIMRSCAAVPIRIGGGTRLKVLEGLAMGKAMVSSAVGCEGVAVRDREHLMIADDAPAFASRISELFEKPGLRDALGQAGRHLIETRYSWKLAGARLDAPKTCKAEE